MSGQSRSTNVFNIPPAILFTGKFLQFFSPYLAARFARMLFSTPYPFKRPDKEMKMYHSYLKDLIPVPAIGKKIRTFVNIKKDNRHKALLVHGWAGRGTQLYKIADALTDNGISVVSFDGPAHGDSEGKSTDMTEFIACIMELEKTYGPFDFIIGHSLGGMSVFPAVNKGLTVQKAVVIGVADSIYKITERFIRRLELKRVVVNHLFALMGRKFKENPENLSAGINARNVHIPVLLIHDVNDKEVPITCAENVAKALPDVKFIKTEKLGHTKILHDPGVIDSIIDFLTKS